MNMSSWWRRQAGVMGMNRRNRIYIDRLNPRRLFPVVDDKLLTKQCLVPHGLPVPETLATFATMYETRSMAEKLPRDRDFVVKPARGRGGGGILVLSWDHDHQLRNGDQRVSMRDLQSHIRLILCGEHSFGDRDDVAFLEEKLTADLRLRELYGHGVADVRIIVYRGRPVMAMLRLPTRRSGGKANLHQGGVGVGLDISTGTTNHAVVGNRPTDVHPDTRCRLIGCQLHHWEAMLAIARKCHEAVPLGYLGVDIIPDEQRGPVVVELNARPGLNIQLANQCGLQEAIERLGSSETTERLGK